MGATRLALLVFALACVQAPARAQQNALEQAVRLDQQLQCSESEVLYRRLLSQGPPSQPLLNNAGNHYLVCGDVEKARGYFELLLKSNPRHRNANLQLARMAAEGRRGKDALEYLARVDDNTPRTRLIRAEAMHWAGRERDALSELDLVAGQIAAAGQGDTGLQFLYGITCARIGAYPRAVEAFSLVLARHPEDLDALFQLGRAAGRAKLYDRAQQALDVVVKLQPANIDALMELAAVSVEKRDFARALYLLVQAGKQALDRPDVPLALAHAAQAGGYYGDAALAFDRYLTLRPDDAAARRDRALACGLTDTRQAEGAKELRAYIGTHPRDPLGPYYLAQITWRENPAAAEAALLSALKLDPSLGSAHVDLGWLLKRGGSTAEAAAHFEKAVAINPNDSRAWDELGAAYLVLERPEESEEALRKAWALSPADPEIMMHLGRALMESGKEQEGRAILQQFKQAHPGTRRTPWREPGMIEAASLSGAERTRRDIERLRQEATLHPDNPEYQFRFASLLLASGDLDSAEREFRVLLLRNADAGLWQQAGAFLLTFERYSLAREFLKRASRSLPGAQVDLAAAVLYSEGGEKALSLLNEAAAEVRETGDYWLLKAEILDAAGQREEAASALDRALAFSSTNPRLVQHAVNLMVRQGRKERALPFLAQAIAQAAGQNPDLLLARALLLATTNQTAEADKALRYIESQWPEWDRTYLVHAMILEPSNPRLAKQKAQTAVALGSNGPTAMCVLSRLTGSTEPGAPTPPDCECAQKLEQLFFPPCLSR